MNNVFVQVRSPIPPIPHVKLSREMAIQRRMFNQKRLVNTCIKRNVTGWKLQRQIHLFEILKYESIAR